MSAPKHTPEQIEAARAEIAAKAEAAGERTFAREVIAGCWDHRNDVMAALERIAKAEGRS